jgi:hypothetical protein
MTSLRLNLTSDERDGLSLSKRLIMSLKMVRSIRAGKRYMN